MELRLPWILIVLCCDYLNEQLKTTITPIFLFSCFFLQLPDLVNLLLWEIYVHFRVWKLLTLINFWPKIQLVNCCTSSFFNISKGKLIRDKCHTNYSRYKLVRTILSCCDAYIKFGVGSPFILVRHFYTRLGLIARFRKSGLKNL